MKPEQAKDKAWSSVRETVPFCLQDSFNLGFDYGQAFGTCEGFFLNSRLFGGKSAIEYIKENGIEEFESLIVRIKSN